MIKEIERIWERIEAWDTMNLDPELGSKLKPGASDAIIVSLNRELGGFLPSEYTESLRRHDGSVDWTTGFHDGHLLGAAEVLATLSERRQLVHELVAANQRNQAVVDVRSITSGPVKNEFWSNSWIPIHATDWSLTCFDFDPAEGGTVGQIIEVDWEGGEVKVIANNYVDFLSMCADELPEDSL